MKVLCYLLFFNISVFSQSWELCNSFPGGVRDDGVALNLNGKGYFGTGRNFGHTAIIGYPGPAKYRSEATLVDDFILIASGSDENNVFQNETWLFDPNNSSWARLSDLPSPLRGTASFSANDKVYFICGLNDGLERIDEVVKIQISAKLIDNDKFLIYPNPATNTLCLEFSDAIDPVQNINIYDNSGKFVKSYNLMKSAFLVVDISKLRSGLYNFELVKKSGSNLYRQFVKTL